jgi:hypothetical protein
MVFKLFYSTRFDVKSMKANMKMNLSLEYQHCKPNNGNRYDKKNRAARLELDKEEKAS